MKFIKNVFLLMMLMFSFNVSASSPEWITHVTKGKVNYTQAKQITKWVYLYSVANDLDPNLVFKVIKVESTFRKTARSKKDGKGLMQIVPKWHKDKIKGRNIYDIRTNIEVGTSILREYKDKYKSTDRALKAYNGSHRSNAYLNKIRKVKLYDYDRPYPGSDSGERI